MIYAGIVINVGCAILAATLARRRGYPWARWLIYGVVAGPVLLFFAARLKDYRRDWKS